MRKVRFDVVVPALALLLTIRVAGAGEATNFLAAKQDPIEVAARAALSERFPSDVHRMEVRVVRSSVAIDSLVDPSIRFPSLNALPRGHVQVEVIDNRRVSPSGRKQWAMLYIGIYDSVAVASTAIKAGASIDRTQVELARIETTRLTGTPIGADQIESMFRNGPMQAARSLKAGQVVRTTDLRLPDVADAGQLVLMTYRRNDLAIQIPCTAREKGKAGDVVRLYSTTTRASYRARLTGPGMAEWISTL